MMVQIVYFYSAHSAYAYLGAPTLARICAKHDVELIHKPIELSPVVAAVGSKPFRHRTQAHVDYFFGRELERWAELRDLPMIDFRPTYHDKPLTLSNGVLIAAQQAGEHVGALSFAILQAHWRDDADISDPATLAALLDAQDIDLAVLEAATSAQVQTEHAANTAEATMRNVFGSPTYFLGDEMFYGQDRLEMLEHALTRPFRPSRFRNPTAA